MCLVLLGLGLPLDRKVLSEVDLSDAQGLALQQRLLFSQTDVQIGVVGLLHALGILEDPFPLFEGFLEFIESLLILGPHSQQESLVQRTRLNSRSLGIARKGLLLLVESFTELCSALFVLQSKFFFRVQTLK